MKLCHMAALATIGWYLISPPYYSQDKSMDLQAPLSRWELVKSFDTATKCEEERQAFIDKSQKRLRNGQGTWWDRASKQPITIFTLMFQCVASDDPRLKEN